jgi:hypothetical protein
MMAALDDARMPLRIPLIGIGGSQLGHLSFESLRQQLLCASPQHLR